MTAEASLRARIAQLEEERRRIFSEAQHEADAMFAQYQLSQLLASGGELDKLASAVLAEIGLTSGAGAAAMWLSSTGDSTLRLVAREEMEAGMSPSPPSFPDPGAAVRWAAAAGWSGVPLEESRALGVGGDSRVTIGFVAVGPAPGRALDPEHVRYLGLVRRELALAFRTAQLRGELGRERATLAAILDGASDAIIAVGRDRRITRLNRAAARLIGGAAREGVGATCSAFLGCLPPGAPTDGAPESSPNSVPVAQACGRTCPFLDVLGHGRPVVREQVVRSAGGEEIPVAASYAPMSGEPAGAVAVLRDLRSVRALDELKSSLVATVSHELRTPLALISGHTQSLLHLGLDAGSSRHHLERIGDAVDRLGVLIDEILDVGRLESDQLVLVRRPTDLSELLRGFAAEQAELPAAPPVTIRVGQLPPVDVDPTRIRQVLANLQANAAKYAGPDAQVTIRARTQGPSSVIVTFADDGPGIANAERDHVFERFFRGGRVRETRIGGNGLGLYICRRLVEEHGGWMRLDAPRHGTSISFRLPVAR